MGSDVKLVSFMRADQSRGIGALLADGGRVCDFAASADLRGLSMVGLIERGGAGLDAARAALDVAESQGEGVCPLSEVTLLPPLQPVHLRCFSVYEKHLTQAIDAVMTERLGGWAVRLNKVLKLFKPPKRFYRIPFYYKGNRLSVSGPGDEIRWPSYADWLDYELELGVVIGKAGRDIAQADAAGHIFGYTIFNDFSARDMLMKELAGQGSGGPAKGKDFDTSNAIGPWIVTADEIADPQALAMTVRVNGAVAGESSTAEMHHSIARMIEYASMDETIHAGELFGTGAASNGSGIEFGKRLAPGDRVELEIEKIGSLQNTIGARAKPAAR